ncbi:MAG: MFS transporter [Clostridia bacterium]|nr:MFS transporter [Clostridia bacterium]
MGQEISTKRTTPLGLRIWISAIAFGLVGQIAWVVENMYFATFAQDIFANSGRTDMSYLVTTLMVWLSAVTATITTIFAGGWCDKTGKRKPFVAYGYIGWGATIMLFAAIPMQASASKIAGVAAMLIVFDCVMTFAGSVANDAAFNTWVTDVTDTTNRGRVNTILALMPVFATIIVFIGLGNLYNASASSNWLFFVVLGAIPMVAGVIAIFLMKDSKNIVKNTNPNFLKETFYGFRPSVAKDNKMLYVCLTTFALLGISQQTFFSYIINFVQNTLELGESYVIPLAVIILGAAAMTGLTGFLSDKFGKKHLIYPLLVVAIAGTLLMYLLKFMSKAVWLPLAYVIGILMLGSLLGLSGILMSSFQDYIPKGYEGRFQGVRMCFSVLIPMIIGPLVTLVLGLKDADTGAVGFKPPFSMFLAASIIAALAAVPAFFVRKDSDRLRESLLQAAEEESEPEQQEEVSEGEGETE